jgi:6-phosphogluconolactonase
MIFYTGCYTQQPAPAQNPHGEGIGCFELDLAKGGMISLGYTRQRNPSYLTISSDGGYLYAVEELTEDMAPKVISYKVGMSGQLSMINSQPLNGDFACHLTIVRDQLIVANYDTGNTQSYPLRKDGGLEPCLQNIQHKGTGPNKTRQEGPHAHMVYPFREDHFYVVDLGIDKAKAYFLDKTTGTWRSASQLDMAIVPGAGARHMIMDKSQSYAYVLSELSGEVFVFKKRGERFELIQKISFVPVEYNDGFGAAAIRLHPTGKFLYTSNRGPDTISIFSVDREGTLSLLSNGGSGGKTPRDFNIDPSGNWLVAANQDSDTLVTFRINQRDGSLSKVAEIGVLTPVNICWLS